MNWERASRPIEIPLDSVKAASIATKTPTEP